jgi:hypothetical protein
MKGISISDENFTKVKELAEVEGTSLTTIANKFIELGFQAIETGGEIKFDKLKKFTPRSAKVPKVKVESTVKAVPKPTSKTKKSGHKFPKAMPAEPTTENIDA